MTEGLNRKKIGFLVTIALVLFLLFGIYTIWRNHQFRVVETTPSLSGTVATSTSVIRLSFNRDLSDDINYDISLVREGSFIRQVERDGRALKLRTSQLEKGKSYSFKLNAVKSNDGSVLSDISYNFKVDYIPHEQLSEKQKRLELEETDRGNYVDPVLSILPYSTLHFTITPSYETGNDHDDDYSVTIHIKILLSNADRDTRDQSIESYKNSALEYLRGNDINLSDYNIVYSVVDPSF